MSSYRSTSTYQIVSDSSDNADLLASWGYDTSMAPMGLYIVYDEKSQMITAVLSADDVAIQFEQIAESVPVTN